MFCTHLSNKGQKISSKYFLIQLNKGSGRGNPCPFFCAKGTKHAPGVWTQPARGAFPVSWSTIKGTKHPFFFVWMDEGVLTSRTRFRAFITLKQRKWVICKTPFFIFKHGKVSHSHPLFRNECESEMASANAISFLSTSSSSSSFYSSSITPKPFPSNRFPPLSTKTGPARFKCSAGQTGFFTRLGRLIKEKAKSDVDKLFSGFSKTRDNLAVIDELLLYWNLAETDRVLDELEEVLLLLLHPPLR